MSQLSDQRETFIYHSDSESVQQNMQRNKRISQNCVFITMRNSVFFSLALLITAKNAHNVFSAIVILCYEPCYYKKQTLLFV